MSDTQVRHLDIEDIEVREEKDGDTTLRTISGIACPWDEVVQTRDIQGGRIKETFVRGAFGEISGVPLFSNHGHLRGEDPIGTVTRGEETDEGFKIVARLSETTKGNDAYVLLKDKALGGLSVGFAEVAGGTRVEKGVHVRSAVRLREVSVVPFSAYTGATITEVRSENEENKEKEATMADNDFAPAADLIEVRESVEELGRKFTAFEGGSTHESGEAFHARSGGEFVKGLLDGSSRDDNEILTRAFTGAVTGDNLGQAPVWIQNEYKFVANNRRIFELFSKEALPAEGLTVNRPVAGVTTTGNVAEQAAQGDDLTYLEVVTTNENFPVKTYGGYSSLSRQAIERNNVSYLNAVLRFQALSYAKATNGAVAASLIASPASYNQYTMGALATQTADGKEWVKAVLNGVGAIEDNSLGLTADVWLVSTAIFNKIANLYDSTGRPLFVVNGDGANTIGNLDVTKRSANVAGLQVYPDPNLTGTDTFIASSEAISVLESGGAPYRLQDENIINLTKDFSLYGYLSVVKNDLKGISRVIVPAT